MLFTPSIIGVALNKKDSYDEKVDIWSLGTLCYEMLFGESLFGKRGNLQIIDDIYFSNIKIPDTISNKAKNFLYGMLAKKGEDRLTSKQLLEHEFLKDDIIIPLDKNLKINNLLSNILTPEKVNNLYEAKNINIMQPIIPKMGSGMFNMQGMGFGINIHKPDIPDIFDNELWLQGFHIGFQPAIDTTKDKAKMNIIFRTTQGTTHNIILNYGTTIDEALTTYLKRVGRPELKYDNRVKINFIFNATRIKFGDQTKIEVFFKNLSTPLVLINDILNLIIPKDHILSHQHNFLKNIINQPELSELIFYKPNTNDYSIIICRNISNKLIRTQIMNKIINYLNNDYFQNQFLIAADDTPLNILAFRYAENYSHINIPGYLYHLRNDGMSSNNKGNIEHDKILSYNFLLYFKFLFKYILYFNMDINFFLYDFGHFAVYLYDLKYLNVSEYIPMAIEFFEEIKRKAIPENFRKYINYLIEYFSH